MKPLSEIKVQRKNLFKNFFLVALLSTGISLLANALTKDSEIAIVVIPGIACILFVAICYIKEFFGYFSYEVKAESVLSVDKDKKIVNIDRYQFGEDLYRTVTSVLSENKAYKRMWEEAFGGEVCEKNKGKDFVNEFLEYQFVYWISLQLNSYFSKLDGCVTETISREQIPDVLIKNRVIELISKPFNEREKFQNVIKDKEPIHGEVVYVGGEDGVFYDKLEIELPRNSKVCREKDTLVIKNRAFDIRFESKFSGFCSVLPRYFEKFYMNRSMEDTHNYRIDLRLSIKLKPLFLIYNNGWKYLGWIDQIGNKFVEYFSYNEFVKKIGYEQAVTNYILFYNRLHPYKETGEDKRIKDVRIIKIESEEKNG